MALGMVVLAVVAVVKAVPLVLEVAVADLHLVSIFSIMVRVLTLYNQVF
jgi:hypothetical protein